MWKKNSTQYIGMLQLLLMLEWDYFCFNLGRLSRMYWHLFLSVLNYYYYTRLLWFQQENIPKKHVNSFDFSHTVTDSKWIHKTSGWLEHFTYMWKVFCKMFKPKYMYYIWQKQFISILILQNCKKNCPSLFTVSTIVT